METPVDMSQISQKPVEVNRTPVRNRPCAATWLGLTDYRAAFDLQKRLWKERLEGRIDDTILLLEHPPTLTIGKSGKISNLLVTQDELTSQGVSLFFTDRGGDVTYHGPGQLVVYPILDLNNHGKDIHRYIFNLQEVVIRTLSDFGIQARRDEKYIGVWVNDEKIAAIGVAVHKWITMHGLALNVDPQLEHFNLINPCGIRDKGVTSMRRLLKRDASMGEVLERIVEHFGEVFETRVEYRA
jgi:lipoate-protein ligase B